MHKQTYLAESDSFNQALDDFAQAVLSGDEKRIRTAREQILKQAPLQAAEYDANVRRGLMRIFTSWQNGETSSEDFGKKFVRAISSGDYYPQPNACLSDFEHAFSHLNFARTQIGGPQYASFGTQRLWTIHHDMVAFKKKENVCA